jgi:fructosamine-3-kinase
MIPGSLKSSILKDLSRITGKNVEFLNFKYSSGGCINSAGKLETTAGRYFVKWNNSNNFPGMFEKEMKGLSLLASKNAIRIPIPISTGHSENQSYIIMEWIEKSARNNDYWEKLGEQLAALHQQVNVSYGLDHDNYIGSLPQVNSFTENWIDFFIESRLEVQIRKAIGSGKISNSHVHSFHQLYKLLPELLANEPPSLLHGDLWSGNLMTDDKGQPALIDPAVYYGNREVEIAFTRLFGGFDNKFYTTYNTVWPLSPGFEVRQDIYNLYPLLVHVNLFGGGYLSQVENILNRFS